MITFEDKAFEQSVLEGRCHIAVPFEVIANIDGRSDADTVELLIYSFCGEIAEKFESRFSSCPFSAEAKAFLYEKLTPVMKKIEYGCVGACERIHYTYQMTDASALNPVCFRGRTERLDKLTAKDIAESDTELSDFSIDPEDELDRIFVIRGEHGEVAAFAAVNDISDDEGFFELTVECAQTYRGRGYGSECVAELAKYLLDRGVSVEYVCGEENLPSVGTAEKVGFTLVRKCMPFVCYHIGEENEEDAVMF